MSSSHSLRRQTVSTSSSSSSSSSSTVSGASGSYTGSTTIRDQIQAEGTFGQSSLLRSKHVATLEVLETYEKNIEALKKENMQLKKLAGVRMDKIDPFLIMLANGV